MIPRIQSLLKVTETVPFHGRSFNCWTAAITAKRRKNFLRTYPVTLVLPDGSSLNIQYSEPRGILVFPRDLTLLSDEERKIVLQRRVPKKKVNIVKDDDADDFDAERYLNLIKQ